MMADAKEQQRRQLVLDALRRIDELQAQLDTAQAAAARAPIAIVGIACRYPGGITDAASFWEVLAGRVDAVAAQPGDAWRRAAWHAADAAAAGPPPPRFGGFIDGIDQFDADFFGITPREATLLDPQHRLALEVAHQALENAGCNIDALQGSPTGVFVGITTAEYHQHLRDILPPHERTPYIATGNYLNAVAGRIAYTLGLHGPSVAVDTACSSSLTAVHLACQALRGDECTLAVAGGVNVILTPGTADTFAKWGMMALDGRCKTFDDAADGFVRSEGCAAVVLKRLDRALADRDRVLGVIEGSAINQDGRSSGLTVPNGQAQEALIRQALAAAGVAPDDIDYVEAHGTGTALGDPIELEALGAVFGASSGPARADKLRVGSVKTNLGHTETAAGLAGLIKCVLALAHDELPAQLHLATPTTQVDWQRMPVTVVAEPQAWPRGARRRRAGVSSFGFSGANAHVILAEPPVPAAAADESAPQPEILALSARDPAALAALARAHAALLRDSDVPLGDICFTANTGRAAMAHRLVVRGDSRADMADQLDAIAGRPLDQCASYARVTGTPRVGFLLTGQGSQYPGMGRGLYDSQPVYRRALDRCAAILADHLDRPLLDIVFAAPGGDAALIDQTRYTQPALFALEWSLAELWRGLGVRPAAMLGHSLGEYVAACQAGVLRLEDALPLVATRARMMQALPAGGMMVSVIADRELVDRVLAPHAARAAIAAQNGPRSFVISGFGDAVTAIVAALADEKLPTATLNVSHAFHSPAMDPMLDGFEAAADAITFAPPGVPVISNLTGARAGAGDLTSGAYWRAHLRQRVRFAEGFAELRAMGCDTFVEIGPDPVLSSMAGRMTTDAVRWLPSLVRGGDDRAQLVASLGDLFVAGAPIAWAALYEGRAVKRCALPTYPFQRQRFWAEAPVPAAPAAQDSAVPRPVPPSPLVAERVFTASLGTAITPDLADHVVGGKVLVPMTAFLTLAIDAAGAMLGTERVALTDVVIAERAVLVDADELALQIVFAPEDDGAGWSVRIISLSDDRPDGYVLHASGRVQRGETAGDPAQSPDAPAGATAIDAQAHLRVTAGRGFAFGPAFQGVARVDAAAGIAVGEIVRDDAPARFSAGLLDVCLQPLVHAWPEGAGGFLPFAIDRVELFGGPAPAMRSVCRARAAGGEGAAAMIGDVTVDDGAGTVLVRVQGLTVRASDGADHAAVDALLYERAWLPVPDCSRQSRAPSAFLLPQAAGAAAARRDARVRAASAGYDEATGALNARAAGFIAWALGALGWTPATGEPLHAAGLARQLGIAPRYTALVGRFLAILADENLCTPDGPGWRATAALPAAVAGAAPPAPLDPRRTAGFAAELRLLDRCGHALPDVLRGRADPLDLLFGQAAEGDLETIYADSPVTLATNEIAADLVGDLVARAGDGDPVRILEIGGGTGGTTKHILRQIGDRRVDYWFTDVGPALVSRARERFRDRPDMTFAVLDIERDLPDQDLAGHRFDIVVAANVLHATGDLTATAAAARRLLKQDGVLVLMEITRPQPWIDLTFGLTDGWWKFADHDVRADYPLLPAPAWRALLDRTGFANAMHLDGPAPPGETSSYAVIAANAAPAPAGRAWLLFSNEDTLAAALRARGEGVIAVRSGDAFQQRSADEFVIRPGERADHDRLLAAIAGRDGAGVAYAWLADRAGRRAPTRHPADAASPVAGLLHLAQALLAHRQLPEAGLWIVTRGAQAAGPDVTRLDPDGAPAWGLGKTLGLEHRELKVRRLDLDPAHRDAASDDVDLIADLLLSPPAQGELALRAGGLHAPRIARRRRPETGAVRVAAQETGNLGSLAWVAGERPVLGPRDVEIQVEAAALNFRDVLRVLGMYSGATGDLGGEVAGTIVAVGAEVRDFLPGDTVGAIAFGGFNSFVKADAALVMRKPADWSFADIASLPSVYATAYDALVNLAQARAGERVLIHTATGGVGLAAIQVARAIGCEIVATAGSDDKRDYLRRHGIAHVFDSRTAGFAEAIRAATGGGVDVIVNTLGAELTDANLAVLAERGRFVELGRRELWDPQRVAAARPHAKYFTVDLARVAGTTPDAIGTMLAAAAAAIADGTLAPLPTTVFAADRVTDAFRLMAQARHIGKVIVVPPRRMAAAPLPRFAARPDRSYLVVGGLGGLGLETARWLVDRGARHLALFARSPADAAADPAVAAMRADGVEVLVVQGDVARQDDVARLFAQVRGGLPALAGIIHSAGVLDDGAFVNQTWPRFEKVLGPKCAGSWNLHAASAGDPLDLFVLYSSATAILGTPGQANHCAANAYQDALIHHRRALGLPGLSIDWGAWGSIGAAAGAAIKSSVATFGVGALRPAEGIAALERLILTGGAQAMAVRIDWDQFLASGRPEAEQAPFAALGTPASSARGARRADPAPAAAPTLDLTHLSGAARRGAVLELVRASLVAIIGMDAQATVDPHRALRDLGIDSLMSVELRNRLQKALGRPLPTTLVFDFPTITALVDHVCADDEPTLAPAARPADHAAARAPAAEPQDVGTLSDEDAEAALLEELALTRSYLQ